MLSPAELLKGDVSMEIVSKRMGRTYTAVEQIRTVCQLIFAALFERSFGPAK